MPGAFECDFGLVGGIVLKQCLELCNSDIRINQGRQSQAKFERGVGTQNIACIFQCRKAFGARDAERGHPGAPHQCFDRIECRRDRHQA